MRTDYQDLQEKDQPRRFWSHGRVWLRRSGDWFHKRCGALEIEWSTPAGHNGWGLTFGGGDAGRDLGFTFAIPWLLSLHVTLDDVFPMYAFGTDFDRGHDRQISCYFYEWTFRWSIWVGSMASWSRDYPWCRWWRQGHVDFKDLALGKTAHELVVLKEGITLRIPLPEGTYSAVAKIERRTWKRPRWFAMVRYYVAVDVPKGLPFAGKGENSWDCGDDGLFGYAVEGTSLEHAIAHGVESVLTSRRRYGHASNEAIRKALA
jgi:hypothetical protein